MVRLATVLFLGLTALGCAVPPDTAPPPVRGSLPDVARLEHDAEAEPQHGEHGKGTQAFNGFIGGSGEVGDLDGFTFGIDYEYRLSPQWGVGGFAEAVSGLDRSLALGAQAYWHAVSEFVLVAGPGVERHHDEWRPIARFGGFYEFDMRGGWVLSPAIFYDVVEGEDLWIYGLNIGYIW